MHRDLRECRVEWLLGGSIGLYLQVAKDGMAKLGGQNRMAMAWLA